MKRLKITVALPITVLGLLLVTNPLSVSGEGLANYGAQMCADAGIPLEECSLVGEDASLEVGAHAGDKSETLIDRARRLCEEEGVPLADCTALPMAYRTSETDALHAAPLLTSPETLPIVKIETVPPSTTVTVQQPVQAPVERVSAPPLPVAMPVQRPQVAPQLRAPAESVPAANPDMRNARIPAPRLDLGFGDPRIPRDQRVVTVDEVTVDEVVETVGPVRALPQRDPGGFTIIEEERFVGVRRDGGTGRCFRFVDFSPPPSYRFINC